MEAGSVGLPLQIWLYCWMTDPAEQPDDAKDDAGGSDGPGDDGEVRDAGSDDGTEDPDLHRAHEIGTAMVEQLGVLLDRWLAQITELVERDIDPAPLLRGLARLMRSAADQLDPDTVTEPGTDSDPEAGWADPE